MKDIPILFQGAMVRALLDGSKTQTRRIVKPQPTHFNPAGVPRLAQPVGDSKVIRCPYGQPGDRLWVREAWTTHKFMDAIPPRDLQTISIAYVADGKIETGKYRQAFHMPRRYSRITLEVTSVRVERLQNISEADAIAEGIEKTPSGFWSLYGQAEVDGTYSPRSSYRALWEQINGLGSWATNPWVWVVEFKRVVNVP